MLDLKFISKHSKALRFDFDLKTFDECGQALRFDFDLKTFDECGQQLEHKTISNYLTVDQSRCSTTQSSAEERVSTFAAAHS
ncbi:MAG: hypothetical protein EBX20_05870 [Rhodobacterales bacterium]|nr:hypothetical protein [Rhodobacterales bacterium]